MGDSFPIELITKKPVSSSARSSERESARPRSHTLSLTTEEPSGTPIQTFKSTIVSSSTSPQVKSMELSCSPVETTLVELVTSNPLKSIRVLTTLPTSETPVEMLSQPVCRTLWSLEIARTQSSPFQRAKVSNLPLWKKEPTESETRKKKGMMRKKMRHECRKCQCYDISTLFILSFNAN